MKKTRTTQIARVPFTMSLEAYETLSLYLENLKKVIHPEYQEETLKDIELRIAELLNQKNQSNQIIEKELIDEIVKIIGKPDEFLEQNEISSASSEHYKFKKKLFRDPDNNLLGGIAAGLSHYLSVHRSVLRILFILLTFYKGIGILLYLFFWAIIPKAKSYVEKMIMKGEEIPSKFLDQSMIDKYYSEKLSSSKNINNIFFVKLLDFIVNILIYTKNFLVNFFSRSALIILSIVILLFLFVMFLTVYGIITDSITINSIKISKENALNYLLLIFPSTLQLVVFIISSIIFAVSLLAALRVGFKILTKKAETKRIKSLFLAVFMLVLSAVFTGAVVFTIKRNFAVKSSYVLQSENFLLSRGDTLFVVPINLISNNVLPIVLTKDSIYLSNIDIILLKSQTNNTKYFLKAEAKGADEIEAFKNIQYIKYQVYRDGNKIYAFSYFTFPKNIGFREQKVVIEVHLPVDQIIYLPEIFFTQYNFFVEEETEVSLPGFYKMTEEGPVKL
ncbi:hypothetical protein JCM31826_08690 [Thermaurantimonas aggregans]|uniref:Uncharacterized protein n=1 Tax=Thermaurantimonas aggregans TaxID=2173829 RepID=A0A401XK21_9FLAO|nr:PspC domain-containing protein [Thermaurantimonas aggregans]MCX8148539.1 PspC domain-containing protein [Thermaurantimonas aggregans]GCD77387.1 hypothetical protein JCM31826_08690 [Thermaurantimonas aggregans]